MTINKQLIVVADGVSEQGQINVKTITRVVEDGSTLSESVQRQVLNPGDSLAGQTSQVTAVANAVWTPGVVAAWRAGQPAPAQVPQALHKWQVMIGLGRDSLRDAVVSYIATLSQDAQVLWTESTMVERSSPLFALAKAHFGWTDAQIDDMFTRYNAITLADITA